MKSILMLGTGGTIASEMTPEGLTPELTPAQLLRYVPAIRELCRVDCLSLFSLDSTNITPAHWLQTAAAIREHYDQYDGFVISHGTDTMAYTAAALSYLVQGSKKPIMLTGAQKPINYDSTDSKLNLMDAFVCASSGLLSGVNIVFSPRGCSPGSTSSSPAASSWAPGRARPAQRALRPSPASTTRTSASCWTTAWCAIWSRSTGRRPSSPTGWTHGWPSSRWPPARSRRCWISC